MSTLDKCRTDVPHIESCDTYLIRKFDRIDNATGQKLPSESSHGKFARATPDTASTTEWKEKFVSAVADRRNSDIFLSRFEEISLWLRKKPTPITADLDHRLTQRGMDLDRARQRSLKLLDNHLAARSDPWSQLGLPHDAQKRTVRERYQRLMQMYHPDKGLGDTDWLTTRVTRVRRAYDEIEANNFSYKPSRPARVPHPDKHLSKEWQEIATANRRRPGNLRSSPQTVPWAIRIRRRLGDAEKFKKRVMFTLVAVGLLYAVVLVHSVYTDLP